jgi:voltage-gated potassium channel
MALLAIVYLAVDVIDDGSQTPPALFTAAFTGIFLLEFAARLVDSTNRWRYCRDHWLDVVSAVPSVGIFRAVRLLRLLRLARSVRGLRFIRQVARDHGRGRGSLWYLGPVALMAWLAAAVAYWTLEHGSGGGVTSFGEALHWAFVTMTTMGYGTRATVDSETEVLTGVMVLVGIGLVTTLGTQFANWLTRDEHAEQLPHRLVAIESELKVLREMLASSIAAERSRTQLSRTRTTSAARARSGSSPVISSRQMKDSPTRTIT